MRRRLTRRLPPAALALTVSLLAPVSVRACSVCLGNGTADNRIEFILTTAFMTFLPLGLIGGLVYWFRRRYLSLAEQEPSNDVPSIRPRGSEGATLRP